MIEITSSYVDSLAPNGAAIKNALGLVQKNKFVQLHHSGSGDLLFGECKGSGSSNYATSADFAVPDKPVFRCSCPSRQFPCKHSLGLMYALVQGQTFTEAPVPDDLAAKRAKAEQREEKKQEAQTTEAGKAAKPKRTNKTAGLKKVASQLEGLDHLDKLLAGFVRRGLGTLDAKSVKALKEQVKAFGNYYLPGVQNELRLLQLQLARKEEAEEGYPNARATLIRLHALSTRGRVHLQSKLNSGEPGPDPGSALDEALGHAWTLAELQQHGLVKEKAAMLQLAFLSYDDGARQEWVDLGYWLDLDSGDVHRTVNYRPYRAARHMKEEDSMGEVLRARELVLYPGNLNRRVRFEEWTSAEPAKEDWTAVRKAAQRSYPDAVKAARNQLRNPLADPLAVVLLEVAETLKTEDGQYAIRSKDGAELALTGALPWDTLALLPHIASDFVHDCCMLVAMAHDSKAGRLAVQPLSIVKEDRVLRLL